MGFAEEIAPIVSGAGTGNLVGTVVGLVFLVVLLGMFAMLYIWYLGVKKYTVNVMIVRQLKSSTDKSEPVYTISWDKGAIVYDQKLKQNVFKLYKRKCIINNYTNDNVLFNMDKGNKAKHFTVLKEVGTKEYQFMPYEVVNKIRFNHKNLNLELLKTETLSNINAKYSSADWINKYGTQIFMGSVMFIQILMVILLIQYGNKILGA